MAAVIELAPVVGIQAACAVLGVPRSSFYRRHRPLHLPCRAVRIGPLSRSGGAGIRAQLPA